MVAIFELPVLYRYDTSSSNASQVGLWCSQYQAIKETPQGWWIQAWVNGKLTKKWISKTARKRFAYQTKELALNSFIKRKKHMIAHLENSLAVTQTAYELALQIQKGEKTDSDSLPNPAYAVSHAFEWDY